MSDAKNVRMYADHLGNPLARNSMSNADVVGCAEMLDAYADLLEAIEAVRADAWQEGASWAFDGTITVDNGHNPYRGGEQA